MAIARPTFSPFGGTFTGSVTVTILSAESGVIRYTTDGSDVTASSTRYTGPLTFMATTTLRARVFRDGSGSSDRGATFVVTASGAADGATGWTPPSATRPGGTVDRPPVIIVAVAVPIISPSGGAFSGPVDVVITAAAGAVIRYTTNGEAVTGSSPVYAGQFSVSQAATVRAKAFLNGQESAEVVAAFTFTVGVERFDWLTSLGIALRGEWVRLETWAVGRVMRAEAGIGAVEAVLVCYQETTTGGNKTVIYWVAREEDIGAVGFAARNWVRGTAPALSGVPGVPT
jgi:hypothetical protein